MVNQYIPEEDLFEIFHYLNQGDRDICKFLILTGYRIDDLLHLRKYQLRKDVITIREMKTNHLRSVAVCSLELMLLCELYGRTGHHFSYAFPSLRCRIGDSKKVHRTTIWRHFEKAVKEAGFEDMGYTLHSLRKVYAVRLYKATRDVLFVQKQLGHKSLATTALYILGAPY